MLPSQNPARLPTLWWLGPDLVTLASIDSGSGHPVVLLHGQPGSGASWEPVTRLLEGDGRVLAPDRIGYGSSPDPARGLAENAEVVAEFLEQRTAMPATVVAHSWSGGVAVLLAARHPEAVSNLVLVGAACTPDSVDVFDRLLNVAVVGDVMTVAGLVAVGAVLPRLRRLARYAPHGLREQLVAALPDESVLGGGRGALVRSRRTFMIEQEALMDELPSVTAALGDLSVPVAVVGGAWDLVVRPEATRSLAQAIPGAELIVVPRAGHFVARDAPETLAEVIRRYTRMAAGQAR